MTAARSVRLKHPIQHCGESVETLELRVPTAELFRVIERAERGKDGTTLPVLAYFTGVSVMTIATLRLADANAVLREVKAIAAEEGLELELDGAGGQGDAEDAEAQPGKA